MSVLPTILSRCQVVPFRHHPGKRGGRHRAEHGRVARAGAHRSRLATAPLRACRGVLEVQRALAFRTRVLEVLGCLRQADDWDAVGPRERARGVGEGPLDVARAEQEQELAENADFLAKSAIRQIEARNKRELTAKS